MGDCGGRDRVRVDGLWGGCWPVGAHDGEAACHFDVALVRSVVVWFADVVSCVWVWMLVKRVVWRMERKEEQTLPFCTSLRIMQYKNIFCFSTLVHTGLMQYNISSQAFWSHLGLGVLRLHTNKESQLQ